MRREDAEAERERLHQEDREHTYFVREHPAGEWEVVGTGIPRPNSDVVAERGAPVDVPDDLRPSSVRQIPPYGPGFA